MNNRPIKFRAWSITGKRMIGWEEMTANHAKVYTYFLWTDMYKLMQYTGLKDKEGREIYEGDIVEYENGNAGYGRPRHEEISRDVIPNLCNHDEYFDDSSWWQTGWVIGNVHENPELLEVE